MLSSIVDIPSLQSCDTDASRSPRGLLRVGRRLAKRCWLDTKTINKPRVFCQNSGGCGSTYIARLLRENGVERAAHEKTPDLLQIGLDHFENPLPEKRLVRLLRYTRHNTFFEANNRLFSLTRELAIAFPNARFIHLHRDAVETVRSSLSKRDLANYLATDIRFRGTLAGPRHSDMFERFCFHWANMNRRIHDDLTYVQSQGFIVNNLQFEDLIAGRVENLEQALGDSLSKKQIRAVNVRPNRPEGRFPAWSEWTKNQQQTFETICGPVMALLNR